MGSSAKKADDREQSQSRAAVHQVGHHLLHSICVGWCTNQAGNQAVSSCTHYKVHQPSRHQLHTIKCMQKAPTGDA